MSFDQETNDYQGYKPLLENYKLIAWGDF
jgi:hypothetical protein